MNAVEEEYRALKKNAGLIDVSIIGKIQIKGKDSFQFIQNLVTGDIGSLDNNKGVCTLICYPDGTVIDTLIVYKFEDDNYLVVIHSGNADKVFKWMINRKRYHNISIINLTDKIYQISLQGPKSISILNDIANEDFAHMEYLNVKKDVVIKGKKAFISKCGYGNEAGFEIFTLREDAKAVIKEILDTGVKDGIRSIGTETRNLLKFESEMPFFIEELAGAITPFEAGLESFIKLDKDDFVGKNALVKQNKAGVKRKVVAFQVDGRTKIPGAGASIIANNKRVGFVAEGHFSPKSKKASGFAIVDCKYSVNGTKVIIDDIDEVMEAKITRFRSYKKRNKCM